MARIIPWSALLACASLVSACGDDGGSATDTENPGPSSSGSPTTTTETPTSSSTDPGSTSDPGSSTEAGSSTGMDTDTPTTGSGTEGTEGTTGGDEVDCDALPPGPFAPTVQFMPFLRSEDLGFNGLGQLAGKSGEEIILVEADGTETVSFPNMPTDNTTYGLRYGSSGTLYAAHPSDGEVVAIEPDGSTSVFITGIGGVNGLYPDLDGNLWTTNFTSVRRYDAAGTPTMIVGGGEANGANGIVYDPDRSVAFFTNYGAGRVAKVDIEDDGSPGEVTALGTVGGALFDGLALDVCGNLYAVNNNPGSETVYRLMLDAEANAIGELTDIVEGGLPMNVANAQFGRGAGFEATSLYATGNPGVVYRLDVGVPGAEIPLP